MSTLVGNPELVVAALREIATKIKNGAWYEYAEEIHLEDDIDYGEGIIKGKRINGIRTITLTWRDVERPVNTKLKKGL